MELEIGEAFKILSVTSQLDDREPSRREVNDFLKRGRGDSAPGPNWIPHKVNQHCEQLRKRVWKLLEAAWRRSRLPEEQLIDRGSLIPRDPTPQA